ncbi:hypothetical protein Cs7R123_56100 [Catellatospora sp. TT07R-123]|uniref:DUF4331 family protein n=1 Tax=Catellatospora sp. TT07R-123 TaxID=2733863 RepID=UPI001B0CBA48|nr:DUF4331 family protein [Catellatospora sp. TT07R-123]GHJ48268.1 hypothetical protein Cs7R123_56100 [Catellatospora sp. TT07R-123]
MSHHLDSPQAREDVRLDLTDVYVFRGATGTALVMNVNHSLAPEITGKPAQPGFHPEARYEFHLDLDGDARPDLTFRVTFGDPGTGGGQTLQLDKVIGGAAEPLATGATGAEVTATGLRAWAGRAGDPFWIDGTVLGAIGAAFATGTRADLGRWTPAEAKNAFAGQTVYSIVLEVDDALLAPARSGDRVGIWGLTSLATDDGGWRPINRFGHPMMQPLFTQQDGDLGDRLNSTDPADDVAAHAERLTGMVAAVVGAYGTAADPRAYAEAVVARLLPDVMPYTIGSPGVYGFGEWNGRSLLDNTPDVMFSLATNTAFSIGLTADAVTARPGTAFPYVATA